MVITPENSETTVVDITNVSGGNGAYENGTQKTTVVINNDDRYGINYQTWSCGIIPSSGWFGYSWQNGMPCPTSPNTPHPWAAYFAGHSGSESVKVLTSGNLKSGDISIHAWYSSNEHNILAAKSDYIVVKLTGNIRMPGNPGVTYWVASAIMITMDQFSELMAQR